MAYFDWTERRRQHIERHDVTMDEWEYVFDNYEDEGFSDSSGRPMRWGCTEHGRLIAVVFEWDDDDQTVIPVTGYDVDA